MLPAPPIKLLDDLNAAGLCFCRDLSMRNRLTAVLESSALASFGCETDELGCARSPPRSR